MEEEVVKTEPEILEFLLTIRGLTQVIPGVLVGDKSLQEWATDRPEIYKDLTYLWEEWDYVYLTTQQYKDLTNTN